MAMKLQFVPEPNDYNASKYQQGKHQQGRHYRGYDRLQYVPDYDSNRNLMQQGGLINEPRYLQFMPPPSDHDQRGGVKVSSRGVNKRRRRKSNHYYEGLKEPNLRKRYQKTWLRLMARMQQVSGLIN